MKRRDFPFGIALVVTVGFGFLLPGTSWAQTTEAFPNLLGAYRGFSQSIGNPEVRGSVELMITAQNPPPDTDFSGFLTMGACCPSSLRVRWTPTGSSSSGAMDPQEVSPARASGKTSPAVAH